MKNLITIKSLSIIVLLSAVLSVPAQDRSRFDPESAESGSTIRNERQESGQRRGNSKAVEAIVQSIGGAAIIFCNTTNKCGGLNASLSTVPSTEYPTEPMTIPAVYEQGTGTGTAESTGPIFPFVAGSTAISIPQGWSTFQLRSSTVVAPAEEYVNGDIRNGVLFGATYGHSATAIAAELMRNSPYLRIADSIYQVRLGDRICEKFNYTGYSQKSRSTEDVDLYVCSMSGGRFSYAIAVSSGKNSAYYKSLNQGIVRTGLARR